MRLIKIKQEDKLKSSDNKAYIHIYHLIKYGNISEDFNYLIGNLMKKLFPLNSTIKINS